MTIEKTLTITGTGASDPIEVGSPRTLTFAAIGDASDYTAAPEFQLVEGGNWVTDESGNLVDTQARTTTGPVLAVRLNVTGMGTATSIEFEVRGSRL